MGKPQTLGETQICSCGTKLVARLTSATEQYPAKLQWQNESEEGRAHFKKNTSNNTFDHVLDGQQIPPSQYTSKAFSPTDGTPVSNSNELVQASEKFFRRFLESAGNIRKSVIPSCNSPEVEAQLELAIARKLVDIALSGRVKQ